MYIKSIVVSLHRKQKQIDMKTLKNELKSVLINKGVNVKSIRFFDYSTPELKISIDWGDYLKVREFTEWNGFNLNFCF